MKPNVWNMKDILNIQMTSVGPKSNKNGANSDYSSLTDSQFLSGSQIWQDNSQSFSQEIGGQSRGSQQASQEINDLKVSANYHTKPFLFGDGKAANTVGGKVMGILDRFEEEKRKAKDNEILMGIQQLHESLENIQRTFLRSVEGSCNITRNAVGEGVDSILKTVQDHFATIKVSIASQTELLENLQSQTDKEMKDMGAKTTLALKDLSSLVVSLQKDLESMKIDQTKEQIVLREIQSLLGKAIMAHSTEVHPSSARMTDSTVQTSPSLVAQFCVEEKCHYEGMRLCNRDITYSERSPEKLNTGACFQALDALPVEKQQQVFNYIEAERSELDAWQKYLHMHSAANSAASPVATTINAFLQDPRRNNAVSGPVHVKPVKNLEDVNDSRSTTWIDMPKQKKLSKRGLGCQTFRKRKRALILPQRCPNLRMALDNIYKDNQHDGGQQKRVPLSAVNAYWKTTNKTFSGTHLPLQQQSTTGKTSRSECRQPLNPWSWSQGNDSSQLIVQYKQPGCMETTIKKQRGVWQLFDFNIDSD